MTVHFIDTNIFMYAVGAEHPFKAPSQKIVQMISEEKIQGVINAEVLQEVLYRYTAIGKPKIGFELFETLIKTFPVIWSVSKEDVIEAKKFQEKFKIRTRDAIHAATMRRNGVSAIYSY